MKSSTKIEITNAWLSQVVDKEIEPVFCDITIENGVITEIHQKDFNKFIAAERDFDKNKYDAGGRVITTPLVNFHDHIYSRLAKGLPSLGPLDNFHNVLKNLWWQLDKALDTDMIRASAKMAAIESIRNGVTYIFDHHASPFAIKNSLTTISSILKQFGLSSALCYEISDRDGDNITQQAIDETVSFVNDNTDENVKAFAGLHASFTIKDETLENISQLINTYDLGIHIHLCEDNVDREMSIEQFNGAPIERLKKYNLLNRKSILSHGVHLTDDEYLVISEKGSVIAYNPDSNMNNAVGLPKFEHVPLNIPIIIGTDGMHANIAKSMKQLFLLFRHQKNDFGNTFKWFRKIYFDSLQFAQSYFPGYPKLAAGNKADLIIWDYIPPTPINSANYWGHYIYGIIERPVKTVIQNGNFLMKDYQLTVYDEETAAREIYEQGNRLFNKIGELAGE
ncbi:amidohydrolase family protein [Bacteroidota bacterium]